MDDFPIVERNAYGPGQRSRDLLLCIACLVSLGLTPWVFPDHVAYLRSHVLTGDYASLVPSLLSYDRAPGESGPSQIRFISWLVLLPLISLSLVWAMLFRVDQTYSIDRTEIVFERRTLLSQSKQRWPVTDIAGVDILTKAGAFVGERYGAKPSETGFQIIIRLKSGEKISLPVRRHYTHALRVKQAIESLIQ